MKSALITGASKGLGRAFVDVLLAQKYLVFACVREVPTELKKNSNLHFVELDVIKDSSIAQAVACIKKQVESLDLLINNAGVNKDTATNNHKELVSNLTNLDRDRLIHMFNVNTISPLLLTKAFLPLLKGNPSFVINISSYRASFHDEVNEPTANYGYRGSKVALNMMTYASVLDLPPNIKTFAVNPGDMKTDMNPDGLEDPNIQAKKIIEITNNWDEDYNGKFLKFDGTLYPL